MTEKKEKIKNFFSLFKKSKTENYIEELPKEFLDAYNLSQAGIDTTDPNPKQESQKPIPTNSSNENNKTTLNGAKNWWEVSEENEKFKAGEDYTDPQNEGGEWGLGVKIDDEVMLYVKKPENPENDEEIHHRVDSQVLPKEDLKLLTKAFPKNSSSNSFSHPKHESEILSPQDRLAFTPGLP